MRRLSRGLNTYEGIVQVRGGVFRRIIAYAQQDAHGLSSLHSIAVQMDGVLTWAKVGNRVVFNG